jgi:2-dehydro-3-deoxyphosphogluconate aldolase/(4S)-4-hydroxy-2-oxoglutarate aldolase
VAAAALSKGRINWRHKRGGNVWSGANGTNGPTTFSHVFVIMAYTPPIARAVSLRLNLDIRLPKWANAGASPFLPFMKLDTLSSLKESGVVAVIRTDTPNDLVAVARALVRGGVRFIEITLTVPGAMAIISEAAAQLKGEEVYIGAGTVLDGSSARAAIQAGASFVVSPGFDLETLRICQTHGVLCMPGALTPTEILHAWRNGADVIKIFPADLGGPEYIKTIKEPLPQIELLPTKGINFETAGAFLKSGAIAVGAGSVLVSRELIKAGNYDQITANAVKFRDIVKASKSSVKK